MEGDKSTCFINVAYGLHGLEISQGNKTIPIAYKSWMNKIKMADMTDISKFIS